jgi:hypothetical protein
MLMLSSHLQLKEKEKSLSHTKSNKQGCLSAWNKLLGISESVVDGWVSQVVSQVLNWALAGDNSLHEESKHGEHSETSILDLLHLELREGIWVISQSKWVKSVTWVETVELSSVKELSRGTESLSLAHQYDQNSDGGDDALGVDEVGVAEVVEAIFREDEGLVLEPNRLWEVNNSVAVEELWGDASESAQHGPTSVDELDLAVAGESLWVSRETGSVPAVVTWVFTLEVAWWVGEGTQEESTVWTVELNSGLGHLLGALR